MTQSFNLLDWAIFITVFLSMLIGFFWGLIRTLVSAFIWVLSFFVSMLAGPALSAGFAQYTGVGSLQLWLTYGCIFIATLVISMIAKVILRFMLTPNQIGFFDRLCGGGLGLVRGILIVSVFLWVMALSGLSSVQGGLYQTSVLAGWFQPYVNMVSQVFPSIGKAIQGAGQQMQGSPSVSPNMNSSVPAPASQNNGGPNPYNMMGPGGSQGSGFLSSLPGMQSLGGWVSTLWNMMVTQVSKVF